MAKMHEYFIGAIFNYQGYYIDMSPTSIHEAIMTDDYKPVPLTEKILTEWLSFHYDGYEYFDESALYSLSDQKSGLYLKVGNAIFKNKPVKYLHELQRIHHALTGEPLTSFKHRKP